MYGSQPKSKNEMDNEERQSVKNLLIISAPLWHKARFEAIKRLRRPVKF